MRYIIIKILFITCIIVVLCYNASAQDIYGVPQIKNYTSATVSSITQTWSIQQDKQGVMYFGNSYGITIFDGTYWQTVKLSNNSSVRSIAISKNEIIYAGGMDELGFLKSDETGSPVYSSLVNKLPTQNRNFGEVKNIFIMNNDVAFLCSSSLFILHNDSFQVIPSSTAFEKGYTVLNRFFVYEQNKGLLELLNNKLVYIEGSDIFKSNFPIVLISQHNNSLLAYTKENDAYQYVDNKFKPVKQSNLQNLNDNKINCGLNLKNGNIVLGTLLNGLLVLNPDGLPIIKIDKNMGVDNNDILSVFSDCYDNLWIGHDNGVTYIEINSPFSYINEQIIQGAGYSAITYKNIIYLGTSQGLFASSVNNNSSPNLPKFRHIPGTEGMVWNLTNIDGTLFLGHNDGTFIVNDYSVVKINNTQGGWAFQKLKNNSEYMIEGCYSGMLLYKKEGKGWKFTRRIQGFNESCRIFEQDENGRIWVAHGYKGIFSFEIDKKLENAINIRFYGIDKGFKSNLGLNVYKISNELVFTSENGGIYSYDDKADSFTINNSFDKYLGPMPKVSRLYEDGNENIWVNEIGRTGILIKQNNGTYIYEYRSFNKLKNALIRGFELFGNLPNNNILFGYGAGFIHYNPIKRKDYNSPFYSLVRKVEIIGFRDSLLFGGENNMPVKSDSKLELKYKYNSLRFTFSAPYFEDIDVIRYKYYLEGFDEKWSDWTTKTVREYTNLSPGKYTFHVKAINIYGIESYEGTYGLNIKPPLYRTWLAYFIYAILGIWLFYLSVKLYSRKKEQKLRRDNILKDREIIALKNQQLSSELDHKNNELGGLTTLIVNKNAILQQIKDYLNSLYTNLGAKEQKEIIVITRKIDEEADIDKEWSLIEPHFDSVHKGFLTKLKAKYPELRPNDLKLCAYIQMNLSSKEIAVLMNNTPHGVEAHRYRLRKTFEFSRDMNFKDFFNSI
jgi:hypothetical protein